MLEDAVLHGQGGTRGNTPHSFHFTTSPQGNFGSGSVVFLPSIGEHGVVVVKMEWWWVQMEWWSVQIEWWVQME